MAPGSGELRVLLPVQLLLYKTRNWWSGSFVLESACPKLKLVEESNLEENESWSGKTISPVSTEELGNKNEPWKGIIPMTLSGYAGEIFNLQILVREEDPHEPWGQSEPENKRSGIIGIWRNGLTLCKNLNAHKSGHYEKNAVVKTWQRENKCRSVFCVYEGNAKHLSRVGSP